MAFTFVFGGMIMVALGWWAQRRAAESIGQVMEMFDDTPIVAFGLISSIYQTLTTGHLVVMLGIFVALFGVIRFFYPDPKTTVLMALLEQSNLDQKNSD